MRFSPENVKFSWSGAIILKDAGKKLMQKEENAINNKVNKRLKGWLSG